MKGQRILIAGCGDLGTALALRLVAAGCRVTGLRRQGALLPDSIAALSADLCDATSVRNAVTGEFDSVVVATAAGQFDPESYRRTYVEGLRNLLDVLVGAPPVLLVSSTGVYHQRDSEWVDEDSPTIPVGFSGRLLLEAERLLLARSDRRATILRFGGIYGPGRDRLLREVRAGLGCPRTPERYSNRIHRDDCVGSMEFLLRHRVSTQRTESVYLGVDSEPAPQWEVRHWLAERLGVALDDSAGSQSARDAGSKRCSNRRLREAGYSFVHPDYRAGYGSMLA